MDIEFRKITEFPRGTLLDLFCGIRLIYLNQQKSDTIAF